MTHSDVVTVFASCIAGLLGFMIIFMTWVVKKLSQHDTALALLVQQVNPPGDKSLRTLLQEIQLKQAESIVPTIAAPHTGG